MIIVIAFKKQIHQKCYRKLTFKHSKLPVQETNQTPEELQTIITNSRPTATTAVPRDYPVNANADGVDTLPKVYVRDDAMADTVLARRDNSTDFASSDVEDQTGRHKPKPLAHPHPELDNSSGSWTPLHPSSIEDQQQPLLTHGTHQQDKVFLTNN